MRWSHRRSRQDHRRDLRRPEQGRGHRREAQGTRLLRENWITTYPRGAGSGDFSVFCCCLAVVFRAQNIDIKHYLINLTPSSWHLQIKEKGLTSQLRSVKPFSLWRRGRDSNPCGVAPKRFSRPPRYDHFDTSPKKMELLIGVEPMTSSLPRMCSTNWAIAASHFFIPSGFWVFISCPWRLYYYSTRSLICQYFFQKNFKNFKIFFYSP